MDQISGGLKIWRLCDSVGLVDTKLCVGRIDGVPTDYLPFPGEEEAAALGLPTYPQKFNGVSSFSCGAEPGDGKSPRVLWSSGSPGARAPKEVLVPLSGGRNSRYLDL